MVPTGRVRAGTPRRPGGGAQPDWDRPAVLPKEPHGEGDQDAIGGDEDGQASWGCGVRKVRQGVVPAVPLHPENRIGMFLADSPGSRDNRIGPLEIPLAI